MFQSSSFFRSRKGRVSSRFYLLYKVEMIACVYLPTLEWVKISNKFLFFVFWKLVWDVLCFGVSFDCLSVFFAVEIFAIGGRMSFSGCCLYKIFASYYLFCHFFFVVAWFYRLFYLFVFFMIFLLVRFFFGVLAFVFLFFFFRCLFLFQDD